MQPSHHNFIARPHRLAGPGQRPFTPSTGVQIPLGTPKISLRYRSALLLESVVYRPMFTKCLAGLQPAGHFHFQQLFGCDPYTALAQSVHHDAPVSVQSGAADIDVRRGGTAMPLWAVTQRENFRHEN